MFNIIALSGKKGSGKSTVAVEFNLKMLSAYKVVAFATPIKEIIATMTGCDLDALEQQKFKDSLTTYLKPDGVAYTYRELMQKIGDLYRQEFGENVFVDQLFHRHRGRNLIIADCRYKNELKAIEERGGVVIRVNRVLTNADSHSSETDLDAHSFKYYINNDCSLEDLRGKVSRMADLLAIKNPEFIL